MPAFLRWDSDPLLLDPTPLKQNTWITANRLLAQEQQEKFLTASKYLFLYPILIRKIDFISGERILQSFPYIVLDQEWALRIRKQSLALAENSHYYFMGSNISKSVRGWQQRIISYLDEQQRLPFPLFRLVPSFEDFFQRKLAVQFQSARGKNYSIPTTLTKQLAYLCGVVNGDGHLHRHWLRVVDETKEHIELISDLFEELFSDSGEIFLTGNAWNVELRSSSAVRLFNFLTDQTIQGAKYDSLREPFVFQKLGEPYRSFYWRGVMDADGSFKQHISFGSASEKYVKDFNDYLHSIGIQSKQGKIGTTAFNLTIPALYRLQFIKRIGVNNPKKREDMLQLFSKIRCKFKGLNQRKLLEGLYFNFLEIPALNVRGLAIRIKQLRGEKTIKERSQELSIATNQYQAYEKATRAIPIRTVQRLFLKSPKDLMNLLSKQTSLLYQIASSQSIKLPIQVTSSIIELLSLFEPTSNYVKILLELPQIQQYVNEIFGLPLINNRLNSRLLVTFCRTFGLYEKPSVSEIDIEPFC